MLAKITHALPDVRDLRATRALRFSNHVTKRNGGSGDENGENSSLTSKYRGTAQDQELSLRKQRSTAL